MGEQLTATVEGSHLLISVPRMSASESSGACEPALPRAHMDKENECSENVKWAEPEAETCSKDRYDMADILLRRVRSDCKRQPGKSLRRHRSAEPSYRQLKVKRSRASAHARRRAASACSEQKRSAHGKTEPAWKVQQRASVMAPV